MFWRYQANFHHTLQQACVQRNAAEVWRREQAKAARIRRSGTCGSAT